MDLIFLRLPKAVLCSLLAFEQNAPTCTSNFCTYLQTGFLLNWYRLQAHWRVIAGPKTEGTFVLLRICLVGEKFKFWYCSIFYFYLINNIQS